MPDFDTREPQEPNEPNRLRIAVIANKLRTLLNATRSRIVLIANRVRSLLIANRLRTLLIGGGTLLFVVVAVPMGPLIYHSSGLGDQQQAAETVTCDTWMLSKTGECFEPGKGSTMDICKAGSRDEVDDETFCRTFN